MAVRIGLEALGVAVPDTYLDMAVLARARGVEPGKFLEGLGVKRMSVPAIDEDTVTLAVRAAQQAFKAGSIDPADIGLCIVGTETAVDHSKPVASWVQGLLGLPRTCRVYETKHACYGGTAGLMTALDWQWSGSAKGKKALVICSDIARYGLRTAGEPTQGAGAVALVVSSSPKLLVFTPGAVGTYSNDVMDFWRPLPSKDAVVDGHYSVRCYLEALEGALAAYRAATGLQQGASAQWGALCYHVPYPKMAKKAHEALCAAEGRVDAADSFATQVRAGLELPQQVGNVYTGSLYLSVASALQSGLELEGRLMGLFSYGSGSCAEFWTGEVLPGAQAWVRALNLKQTLDARVELTLEQYEQVMVVRESLDVKPVEGTSGPFRYAGTDAQKRVYTRP
jgi:hydroxymethylglutaryl-CoA synthase